MGSVVLKSLSVLLGIFFIFVGTMKLTSIVSKDLHKDLVGCYSVRGFIWCIVVWWGYVGKIVMRLLQRVYRNIQTSKLNKSLVDITHWYSCLFINKHSVYSFITFLFFPKLHWRITSLGNLKPNFIKFVFVITMLSIWMLLF